MLWAAPCTARRHCIFVVGEVPITTTATINTGLIRRQTLIYRRTRSNDFLAVNSGRFIVRRNYDKTLSEFEQMSGLKQMHYNAQKLYA